jgi:hypothetical protein
MTNASTVFLAAICLLGAVGAGAKDKDEKDKDKDKDAQPLNVILRTSERVMTLAPGEYTEVATVCLPGETVISGGPNEIPAQVDIVFSSFFFDGFGSGWQVQWRNNGTQTVTVAASTSALCVKGTMTLG